MIVKCIATQAGDALLSPLDPGFQRDRSFGVVLGREYLVISLTVDTGPLSDGRGTWVDILMDTEIPTVISVPLGLFKVVDPRVSRYWEIRVSDDGVTFRPPSLYKGYYHDDLSNRDTETVNDFWRVYRALKAEANERPIIQF
jgi:hypothetical protein